MFNTHIGIYATVSRHSTPGAINPAASNLFPWKASGPASRCSNRLSNLFLIRLIVLSLFAFTATSMAGTISLDTSVTVNKRETDVEIEVRVVNRGDDTAYRVQPAARIGEVTYEFESSTVGPERRRVFSNSQKVPILAEMKPGEYPIPVMVAYHDSEGALFHAPAYGILQTAETDFTPEIKIQADAVNLRATARIPVRIQTTGLPEGATVTVTPHTTPVVAVSPSSAGVPVVDGQFATVEFDIRNDSGTAGAVMPLIFFVKTESVDAHSTLVHDVPLTIVEDSAFSDSAQESRQHLRLMLGIGLVQRKD